MKASDKELWGNNNTPRIPAATQAHQLSREKRHATITLQVTGPTHAATAWSCHRCCESQRMETQNMQTRSSHRSDAEARHHGACDMHRVSALERYRRRNPGAQVPDPRFAERVED